jgi:hypothetical protein
MNLISAARRFNTIRPRNKCSLFSKPKFGVRFANTVSGFDSKEKQLKATLTLEDGSTFEGISFGSENPVNGEVVFSTGMVGYTESLTDPSFRGQVAELPILLKTHIFLAIINFIFKFNLLLKDLNIDLPNGWQLRSSLQHIRQMGIANGIRKHQHPRVCSHCARLFLYIFALGCKNVSFAMA